MNIDELSSQVSEIRNDNKILHEQLSTIAEAIIELKNIYSKTTTVEHSVLQLQNKIIEIDVVSKKNESFFKNAVYTLIGAASIAIICFCAYSIFHKTEYHRYYHYYYHKK